MTMSVRRALARLDFAVPALAFAIVGASCRGEVVGGVASRKGAVTTPDDPGAADVRFSIDASSSTPISRFIYGVNFLESPPDAAIPAWPRNLTLSRFGGNRLTAYNWENNASNAGNDYNYQNDDFLGGGNVAGEASRMRVANAAARGAGIIVTVPMIGYVAKDKAGTSVGSDSASLAQRLATRFVVSRPRKGAPFSAAPDTTDGYVNQDEFVWWLTQRFPGATTSATTPLFFSLDNEPDIWGSTHQEIRPKVNGSDALLTYDEFIATTVDYASAIKSVAPQATVFGPAVATWTGAATLGRWPTADPKYGTQFFLDVYLDKLKAAEQSSGHRLVDVLDIHWYPAAGNGAYEIDNDYAPQTADLVEARLQAPRSLWDPGYNERSWVNDVQGGPIRLLPLLREKIAAHYPGTKIAISEYYYGRGGDISGGIAQADVLGIFGREGVFAATLWPNAGLWADPYGGDPAKAYAYVIGALRMFRDFDGNGGTFGSRALAATNSSISTSSVYASADTDAPARVVIVAINKTATATTAGISVAGAQAMHTAQVYVMRDRAPAPQRQADIAITRQNAFVYQMPPLSVTTLVLRP